MFSFFSKERQKKKSVCLKKGNIHGNIYYTVICCLACFQSAIAHPDGNILLDILQEGALLQPLAW